MGLLDIFKKKKVELTEERFSPGSFLNNRDKKGPYCMWSAPCQVDRRKNKRMFN